MSAAPTLPAAVTLTRTEAVLRTVTQTIEELKRGELHCETLFANYHKARDAALAEGISVDVELSPGYAAFYADWKQRKARREGRELARADAEADTWPIESLVGE